MNEEKSGFSVHKGTVYYTFMPEGQTGRGLDHMVGEKLLEQALYRERGRSLRFEPREKGEHGKPFFAMIPDLHYNITHSGSVVALIMADCEVGLDVQIMREARFERLLDYMVTPEHKEEILREPDLCGSFYKQWVLREAYVKWTGEGLTRKLSAVDPDRAWYYIFRDPLPEGYMGAVCAGRPVELSWVRVPMPAL